MKSDLKMPAPSQCFVHKPDEKRQLEHCIEKAMLDLLSKCMFGGIMITYNAPGFPLYYIDEQTTFFSFAFPAITRIQSPFPLHQFSGLLSIL